MSRTKGKRFADSKASDSKSPKNKNKLKRCIFNTIIVICVIAIIISSYNIIIWLIENSKSKKMLDDIFGQVSVTEEEININDTLIKKRHYDISKLLSQNADTVGWLYVENTNIDYPVVQTTDNDYYLTHSFDRSYNSAGWIFADYRCNFQGKGYNTVIYGHNRKDASMFGSLQRSLTEEWYSEEGNLYINFSTLNGDHVYRIFSTFVCNDEDVAGYTKTIFSSQDDFNDYVKMLERHSSHDFETDIENPEQILTLYTCYGLNNQRLLVCAVLVD